MMRRATLFLGAAVACAALALGCGEERTKRESVIPGNTGKANPQGAVGKPKMDKPPPPPPPPRRH